MLVVDSVDGRNPIANKNCDCRKTNYKHTIQPLPPADSAELELCKRCCVNGKCTINQLLKICQEDPDSIMNAFKIAKAEEKCLPEVELETDVIDEAHNKSEDIHEHVDTQNKYHFLMVDNSTSYQLHQESSEIEIATGDHNKIDSTHSIYFDSSTTTKNEPKKEESAKNTLNSSPRSVRSKLESGSNNILTKHSSLHVLNHRGKIFWSDSDPTDDQTPPSCFLRRSPKQSIHTSGSINSKVGPEKTKSLLWSDESYPESDDVSNVHRAKTNWNRHSDTSEVSTLENSPSSHLELIMRWKKNELQAQPKETLLLGLPEAELHPEVEANKESSEKIKSKYWRKCFNCFKRKKKTKTVKDSTATFEITTDTEESGSYY